MRLVRTAGSAGRFFAASVLGRPRLLGVGWAITHRCNSRCPFCSRHSGPEGISTEAALDVIEELGDEGCRRVHFTGGEPLVRKDLGELIARCSERGMTTSVNTNGALLVERPEVVARAGSFLVSVDGPEAIHDRYRGRGSFARLVSGIELLRREQKPLLLSVTVFRENLDQVPFFLELARRFDTRLVLQPGATHVLGSTEANPRLRVRSAFGRSFASCSRIRARFERIWNSPAGLRELMRFPAQHRLKSHAGRISARLEVDGRLYPCSRAVNDPAALPAPNVLELGVREAFRRLPRIDCSGHVCQCAHNVEKSLLFSHSPAAWWDFATRRFGELRRMAG